MLCNCDISAIGYDTVRITPRLSRTVQEIQLLDFLSSHLRRRSFAGEDVLCSLAATLDHCLVIQHEESFRKWANGPAEGQSGGLN